MKKERGITLIELLNYIAILLFLFFVYKISYFLFGEEWFSWLITGISFLFLLLIIRKLDFAFHEKVLRNVEGVFLAIEKNDIDRLQNFFNSNKYNLNITNSKGESLLFFSVKCGNTEVIDYILSCRSKYLPNLPHDNEAYHYALVRKMNEIVDLFEKNGYTC